LERLVKQAQKSVLYDGEWSKGILQEGLVACKAARTQHHQQWSHHSHQLADCIGLRGSGLLGVASLRAAAACACKNVKANAK
jgi:hypothetical protein